MQFFGIVDGKIGLAFVVRIGIIATFAEILKL
jgi:hypothetical protein